MNSKIPFKNSFAEFNFDGFDIKNPMQNTLMTINEIGKTVINLDILDNTNQILKNKEQQRKMEQKKFVEEQERKLKSQLQKQRNQQIVIEDENKTKQINEAFQIDVSSLYQSIPPIFPLLDDSKVNENNWKKITRTVMTPVQPINSYFSELQSGQNEDLERYKQLNLRSNISSQSCSRSEKSFDLNFNFNIDNKDKITNNKQQNDKILHTEQENQEFLLYTLSQDFVQSAIKNKDKNQKKFRRINIQSLEKEVKFNLLENENQDYQFISKERYTPKIFLDKKLVLIENTCSKYPPYHPSLQSESQKYRMSFFQKSSSQENLQKSLSMYSTIYRKQQEAKEDFKNFQKFMSFKSEHVLDKQRKRNDVIFESVFDNIFNKGTKEKNSSKKNKSHYMKSPRSRVKANNESTLPLGNLINKITRDLRRKSCHCSECGDLTKKQKDNYLIVLDNEKKSNIKSSQFVTSPRRKEFIDAEQKQQNSTQASSNPTHSNFFQAQKQKNSLSRRSSLLQLNLKTSVHESKKDDDSQLNEDTMSTYKIQVQPLEKQNSNNSAQTFQNPQLRIQTENIGSDRLFNPRNSSKSLHIQANKVYQMKLDMQKSIQSSNKPNYQQKQRYVYPSPNDLKLKQMLHGSENNYILNKAQNECQNQYRRIQEHIKRNITSQGSTRSNKDSFILNDSNRNEFLRQANKTFMDNCQKSAYLKKLRNDRSNPSISRSQFQLEGVESNYKQIKSPTKQQIAQSYGQTSKQFLNSRRQSDFNSKAYSSHSTFQSTRGFNRERKYFSTHQDQTEQQIKDTK